MGYPELGAWAICVARLSYRLSFADVCECEGPRRINILIANLFISISSIYFLFAKGWGWLGDRLEDYIKWRMLEREVQWDHEIVLGRVVVSLGKKSCYWRHRVMTETQICNVLFLLNFFGNFIHKYNIFRSYPACLLPTPPEQHKLISISCLLLFPFYLL